MGSNLYQYALIGLGFLATFFFALFWQREIFPEYKIYQEDYVNLEKFRSSYTHEPPPAFRMGVKQLVFEREDKGPPRIDRCVTCHVALQFPHFSPTRLARDINGNIEYDAQGHPIQVPNEDYIWTRLDREIERLLDPKVNEQLSQQGEGWRVKENLKQAESYKALKRAKVGEHVYDVTKVLRMHPLMGRETRPFEYHPVEEYGCVSCHSGNGRGLTTEKAHGPVFDREYEIEFMGPKPHFTEEDLKNDPPFARMFNDKPGPSMLFQTTPILIGTLIQAKCMNCHQDSGSALQNAVTNASDVAKRRNQQIDAIQISLFNEKQALITSLELAAAIKKDGLKKTLEKLKLEEQDYTLPQDQLDRLHAQITSLGQPGMTEQKLIKQLDEKVSQLLGSTELSNELLNKYRLSDGNASQFIDQFLVERRNDRDAKGSVFEKMDALDLERSIMRHILDTQTSFKKAVTDEKVISAISSDIDLLTSQYKRGEDLYISQSCYACHRIAGFARGGVGPELTRAGRSYPWFIKESIVWPQADLPTSTMPNFRMDHEDIQDLMTFLLGQTGENNILSDTEYKVKIQEWEAGKKMDWEKPIPPDQIHNLRDSMTVFAEQGCSACHRLKGFESDVGYRIEKEESGKLDFETRYRESEWFKNLIPEMIMGSELVKVLEKYGEEIDSHIVNHVRQGSILEEIDAKIPGQVESLYTPFKYASRAKNFEYSKKIAAEKDLAKKDKLQKEWDLWKDRVHRVLMVFIQEYGLGRLIGPRPNWSGIYRSDEWLMEHFKAPTSHVPRSIMPVFPFDDSKFYALTFMLDTLGKRNRDEVRRVWETRGFNPQQAYNIYCSQCHGDFLQGNGPVSEWIYPIPKNLRNADFLRNLTKERVIFSLTHGVKGTPMPPWGEIGSHKEGPPVLKKNEIQQLADWIFSTLPGGLVIRGAEDVPKWQYKPEDVIQELLEEGNELKAGPKGEVKEQTEANPPASMKSQLSFLPRGEGYLASLNPLPMNATQENISEIFDVEENPPSWPDKYSYFIKKKYYTDQNIQAGKTFFELNCAACHGKEADGSGTRASAMREAKPRMLTNLDWGNSRDDLRWLRSIKFGVPGTAMNPWGDLTSSLQRLQLVIYIRTLSQENKLREKLNTSLYQSYEHEILTVEEARITEYSKLSKEQEKLNELQNQRIKFYENFQAGEPLPKEALDIYHQELITLRNYREREEVDKILKDLQGKIINERETYQNIGVALITKLKEEEIFDQFLELIAINQNRYQYEKGNLSTNLSLEKENQMAKIGTKIVSQLNGMIQQVEDEKKLVEGKIESPEKAQELTRLNSTISTLTQIKVKIISGLEEAVRLRKDQLRLYNLYEDKIKKLGPT